MDRTIEDMIADLKNYPQRELTHELVTIWLRDAYAKGRRAEQQEHDASGGSK
jgi:hypothetical protein